MAPEDNTNPNETSTSQPTIPTTNPTVGSTPPKLKKPMFLIGGIIIVIILIVIGVLVFGGTDKTTNTTSTKNGTTTVSNANLTGAAIKGLQLDATLGKGYEQQSAQASDVSELKKQVSDEGLSDQLTINGAVGYGTTEQTGGNGILIEWGTTGSAYNKQSYTNKYNAYAAQTYQSSGITAQTADGQAITVKTADGRSFSVPCSITTLGSSDDSKTYSIACQGTLGNSKAFVSYSGISNVSQQDAQDIISKFVAASKLQIN